MRVHGDNADEAVTMVRHGMKPVDAIRATFVRDHGLEVERAAVRIAGHVRRTPALATDLDPRLVLKPENLQVTGAFKARGAFNAILSLKEQDPSATAVLAVSSGNHAQSVAYAARACGLGAVLVIPEGANPLKVAGTIAYGAEVVQEGVTFNNREEFAAALAEERGLPMVHPFDNWDVIHGQGTVALELLADCDDLAAIVAPVGGGGLISGIALAVRSHRPEVKVIGVEPALADDAARSLRNGVHQAFESTPATIADGVKVLSIGRRNFEVIVERGLVDEIVTVNEDELKDGLRRAWASTRLFIEPTSALPIAAFLANRLPVAGDGRVALVLSGGNFDPAVVVGIMGPGPGAA